MKKTFITILCLLAAFGAFAQDIMDRAEYQYNIARSLWYNSSSAAGLAWEDMSPWRNVAASYSLANGAFTDSWNSQSQMDLSLAGDMMVEVGGFKVFADLSLERDLLGKCRYNTSLFDVAWDMPFYAAVNTEEPFKWRRSAASVGMNIASPLLVNDMLSAGLAFRMDLQGATKNADPKCRYRGLSLDFTPSATFAVNDENIVGLSLTYKVKPSRSILTSDDPSSKVFFLSGLGEYTNRWVSGDIGIAPIDYNSKVLGVALQYNNYRDASDWLLELSLDKWKTNVLEDDVTLGRVDKYVTGFSATGLMGEKRNRKLTFGVNYNLNYWLQGVNATTMGNNGIIDGTLDYTIYTGVDGQTFNWTFALGMDMAMLMLNRYFPDSSLSSSRVLPYACIGKNILIADVHSLLARLKAGYNFAANTRFKYGGTASEGNKIVNCMLDDEVDYLGSYYLDTRFSLDYTYRVFAGLSAYASLSGGLLKPMDSNSSRFLLSMSVGVLF